VEAARAVIAFSFETIGAKSLSAGHHPQNAASKKVLEKLGFQYTHDEFFAALGMDIPYYLLIGPGGTLRDYDAGTGFAGERGAGGQRRDGH
jgi:RimJ/RimL family protein N-acetyltransferase